MFIDTILEGIRNLPVMIFSVTAIEVIHSNKIVRLKGIGKFIGDSKIPLVAYFIGIIIVLVTV